MPNNQLETKSYLVGAPHALLPYTAVSPEAAVQAYADDMLMDTRTWPDDNQVTVLDPAAASRHDFVLVVARRVQVTVTTSVVSVVTTELPEKKAAAA